MSRGKFKSSVLAGSHSRLPPIPGQPFSVRLYAPSRSGGRVELACESPLPVRNRASLNHLPFQPA